jgi:hypothetical protein
MSAGFGRFGTLVERGEAESLGNEAMEAEFFAWWHDNSRMLEAGFPVDFNHLRLKLNAAFAKASRSVE